MDEEKEKKSQRGELRSGDVTKEIGGSRTMGRGTRGVCSEPLTPDCTLPRGRERLQPASLFLSVELEARKFNIFCFAEERAAYSGL